MPLREYVCKACGRAFEALERAGEKPSCPDCGSVRLERQLSAFSPKSSSGGAGGLPPCADGCPTAGASGCGCGCGCAGHHHHH